MLAIREIWRNFRDDSGHQHFGPEALSGELGVVQQVLEYGQANDSLGKFDARVVAVTMKASLDALLNQLATDPELDLEAYGAELVRLLSAPPAVRSLIHGRRRRPTSPVHPTNVCAPERCGP